MLCTKLLSILKNKVDNFDSILLKAEHALVVFYAPCCGLCKRIKPELEKATRRIKTEKETDFVSFIHTQKNHPAQFAAAPKTSQEAGFGVNVILATDNDFMTIVASGKPTFVMFYASWCGHCSTVKPAFSRLCTTFKEEGNPVQAIAIDAAENPKTADFAGIETLPTFKIFASGKELAIYDGDRSYDNMLSFCRSYLNVKEL